MLPQLSEKMKILKFNGDPRAAPTSETTGGWAQHNFYFPRLSLTCFLDRTSRKIYQFMLVVNILTWKSISTGKWCKARANVTTIRSAVLASYADGNELAFHTFFILKETLFHILFSFFSCFYFRRRTDGVIYTFTSQDSLFLKAPNELN